MGLQLIGQVATSSTTLTVFATSGYQVPAGKTLYVTRLRIIIQSPAGAGSVAAVGTATGSGGAGFNGIETPANFAEDVNALGGGVIFVVASGLFIAMKITPTTAAAAFGFSITGYEE